MKSAVDPGDIVQLPFEKPDQTNPMEIQRFENKLDNLKGQQDATVKELIEVTKYYEYYRRGPQGVSPDPQTGERLGFGFNALRKELKRNDLQKDTAERGKQIRLYEDSLQTEIDK